MSVTLFGLDAALDYLKKVEGGITAFDGMQIRVGNPLPYAYGIITGFRRNGQVARRAGGSFSLPRALQRVRPQVAPTIAFALPLGRNSVLSALTSLGLAVKQDTQANEVVDTGRLRASYTVTLRPGRG